MAVLLCSLTFRYVFSLPLFTGSSMGEEMEKEIMLKRASMKQQILAGLAGEVVHSDEKKARLLQRINDCERFESIKNVERTRLRQRRQDSPPPRTIRVQRFRSPFMRPVAAALVLGVSVTVIAFHPHSIRGPENQQIEMTAADLPPGGHKATLTLSDDQQVTLDNSIGGTIAEQGSVSVVKEDSGTISYRSNKDKRYTEHMAGYNTLSTPSGGMYRVILPDGTVVCLNAASSLHYPPLFTRNTRAVELTGEAYFEVKHLENAGGPGTIPFEVNVGKMKVDVVGTHFNISAYPDQTGTLITLLQGIVQLHSGSRQVELKAGWQAQVTDRGTFNLQKIPNSSAIAWTKNLFVLDGHAFQDDVAEIARWYNARVIYEGRVPGIQLNGTIPRSDRLSAVLEKINLTGMVRCQIVKDTIVVKP